MALFGVIDVLAGHVKDLPQIVQMFNLISQITQAPSLQLLVDLFNCLLSKSRQVMPLGALLFSNRPVRGIRLD